MRNWETVEFRKTGDTAHMKGNYAAYTEYRKACRVDVMSQNAGQLTLSDGRVVEVDDYHWRTPERMEKTHNNPQCGFLTWYEQIGFYRYAKGRYIILCSELTT